MDSESESGAPLASFEAKWTAAHPEFGLALRFVAERDRSARAAFACLVFELEHAAFATRDAEPAALKLQWWAEEIVRAGKGEARHPLTQTLAAHPAFASIAPASWFAAIRGALAQRDPEPAADRAALLRNYAQLYVPLADVEATLFAGVDAVAIAQVATASRALQETASLSDSLRAGRLPLPLDVLARHRLARGDLARASSQQTAALTDWLQAIAGELTGVPPASLGTVRAALAAANRTRARQAAHAKDPLAALNAGFGRLPFGALWAAWRAGLRSSA
jgi:15-cis-phytoene synthase